MMADSAFVGAGHARPAANRRQVGYSFRKSVTSGKLSK